MRSNSFKILLTLALASLLLEGCTSTVPTAVANPDEDTSRTATVQPAGQRNVDSNPVPAKPTFEVVTPSEQPSLPPANYGPDQAGFPPGYSPLTGQPVADPGLLDQPALLVSITHFPPEVRPQGGLSSASWVFEYLIGAGSTRFTAIFHGQMPFPEAPLTGDCEVRAEPFEQAGFLLGNRVWMDKNADGIQSPEEPGVGGVCVNLLGVDGKLIQGTSTDSNGYFGFNVETGTYTLEFVKPEGWEFTEPNVGYEDTDSDADQATGRTEAIHVDSDIRGWDAGLMRLVEPDPAEIPPAEIGPVRSARLIHIHLQNSFQDSCLIYAGATDEIEDKIPGCATVFKRGDGGMGSMLEIPRMLAISEEHHRKEGNNFNYANNLFSETTPAGGKPASQVDMFFSQLNQSRWVYDPAYQGWLRYVDKTSEQTEFHADTDRLNGRQVEFENLIVLFVEHELIQPTIIDMYMGQGELENGLAFRDGQMYEIKWNTRAGEYERETGFRRPIAFQDKNGEPFPLRPGRSWIIIATPYSDYSQNEPGKWKFRVYAPPGTGDY